MVCFVSLPVAAQVVSIDPPELVSPAEGEQFEVNVKITGATNLYAFAADLKFDPQAVQVATVEDNDELVVGEETSSEEADSEPLIKPGDFLLSGEHPPQLLLLNGVDNEAGLIKNILLLKVRKEDVPESLQGSNGDGVLLTITFEVKSVVESDLELQNVQLSNPDGEKTTAQTESGKINPLPEREKGDVDGDGEITIFDGILALKIYAEVYEPTELEKYAADMDDNGEISILDGIAVLKKYASVPAPALLSWYPVKSFALRISDAEGVAGKKSSALLTVNQPQVVSGAGITITYDSTVLLATDVAPATSKDTLLVVNLSKPGVIRLATANLKASEKSVLATIHFNVLRDDKTELKLKDIELYGFDALPIAATGINGKFTSPLIVPDKSMLRQNFPNPFNPETWIPYQLKDSGKVVISIYDASGRVIRKFDLGYQPAGIYSTSPRAVHWDGRNNAGEQVTSGLYFYTLKTKSFTQTRRMLLLK